MKNFIKTCGFSLLLGILFSGGLYFLSFTSFAQPTVQWDKTFGGSESDELYSTTPTPDGGYLLGGRSNSNISGEKSGNSNGDWDYWVVKMDGNGNKIWDRTFGGPGYDELFSTSPSPDGGFILAGFSNSDASGDKSEDSKGNWDFWVVKIDGSGNKVWDKTIGGSGPDHVLSSTPTPDGGYLLGGYSDSNASGDKTENARGSWDYWVVKIDGNGNKIWDRTFGGSEEDYLRSVHTTPDGGYLLTGDSGSNAPGDKSENSKGLFDYWVIKIDGNGNKVWDKTIGGSGFDRHRSTTPTPDGGYLLTGYSESNASGDKSDDSKGDFDYWVVKIDGNGNQIWDKTIGGAGVEEQYGTTPTPDGGYLLGGRSKSDSSGDKSENNKGDWDYWLVKIDGNGIKVWDKTIGGDNIEYPRSINLAPDGGYLMSGYSNSPASGDKSEDSRGGNDFWVVKLQGEPTVVDPSPSIQWDKTFGGNDADQLFSTAPTPDGGYLLAGESWSGATGDKSGDRKGSTSSRDYWVVKIDGSGNKVWDKTFGGSNEDQLRSTTPTPDGGYLLAGFSNSPASGDKSENSKGAYDYWVVKIDGNGRKVWDKTFGGSSNETLTSTIPTPDGGYLLAGFSESPASGDKSEDRKGGSDYSDYWVVKIDGSGNKVWEKTIGGSHIDQLTSTSSTPDGGYLLAGSSISPVSGDKSEDSKGGSDYWVVKIDGSGNKVWDKTIGGNITDQLNSITPTPDGGYLLAGYSSSPASGDKSEDSKGFADFWVVKIDGNGHKIWDKTFGGSNDDILTSITPTPDGGYLLAGESESPASGNKSEGSKGDADYWVVKINGSGNMVWDKTIGGDSGDILSSTTPSPDGGYLLAGFSNSPASGDKSEDSKGDHDFWVVKLHGELVQDNEPPVIGEIAPITAITNYMGCAAHLEFSATVTDNIDASVSPVFSILLDGVRTEISSPDFFPLGETLVYVNASDAAGNEALERTFTVTVEDGTPPYIDETPPITVNTDAGTCSASVAFAYDVFIADDCDGILFPPMSSIMLDGVRTEISSPYTFPLGETLVYLNATDAAGNEAIEETLTVTVANTIPVITGSLTAPVDPNPLGTPVTIYDVVTDNNIASAEWHWSDGSVSPGTLIFDSSAETYLVRGDRTFDNPGTYTVELRVADLCGGTAARSYQHIFTVNGSAKGMAIGGGTIYSPQGAYTADASLTGNARFFFSFHNHYSNSPIGSVLFRFGRANLNFWSWDLEWMNIEGTSVQLKGVGTINGRGSYGFFLSLVDGAPRDRFRIKIWDQYSGLVVYDNETGSPEDAEPGRGLTWGGIAVYPSISGPGFRLGIPQTEAALPNRETGELSASEIKVYPNPVREVLYIDMESDYTETVTLSIHDMAGRTLHEESRTVHKGPNRIVLDAGDWNANTQQILFRLMSPSTGFHQKVLLKP